MGGVALFWLLAWAVLFVCLCEFVAGVAFCDRFICCVLIVLRFIVLCGIWLGFAVCGFALVVVVLI